MQSAMSGAARLFSCRLCWQVTLAVFGLILAVESVILVPSARKFEQNEHARLAAGAMAAVDAVLILHDPNVGPRWPELGLLVGRNGLAAVTIFSATGERIAGAGVGNALLALPGELPFSQASTDAGVWLDVAWRTSVADAPTVVARVDAADVAGNVLAYTLRIAGLVAIIVLVVTAGTMLVLHVAVLKPIMRLRDSALGAGADPDHPEAYLLRTGRRDEIGELTSAFNAMLERMAASKQRDREMADERARFVARHDPLSGLPNRASLLEHLERLTAQVDGSGRCAALYLVNLVEFRVLNASLGPQQGDRLLLEVGARLRRAARAEDFVAHLGADRFAVARIESCAGGEASAFAEQLLGHASAAYRSGAIDFRPPVRVGIAVTEDAAVEAREQLAQAEMALARTHAEEGARYQFYSADLASEARERQELAQDLDRAISRNEFFAVLQPKVSLQGDAGTTLSGAEVLLRWQHPTRGMVSPAVFIPLAEATGAILPIGDFVLRSACFQIRDWRARYGTSPPLAVNLSARQFAQPDLETRLRRVLDDSGIPPQLLELEVTETAAMQDVERTAVTLRALRSLGVRISIDDFGTGYSSLSYLRRFDVDAIKIDKSFVDDIGSDRNAEAICDAILRLGQSLGTKVIAEGVETEAQAEFLRQRRCDEAQGYLFAKPMRVEEFELGWVALRAAA